MLKMLLNLKAYISRLAIRAINKGRNPTYDLSKDALQEHLHDLFFDRENGLNDLGLLANRKSNFVE